MEPNWHGEIVYAALKLNLNVKSKDSLWKDRALVELNITVLHSFHSAGVTIVDHHTASRQFMVFGEQECKAQRRVFGDWGWLVPPMSGSHTIEKPSNFLKTFIVLYHLTIALSLCIILLCLLITEGKPSPFAFDKCLFHYQRQSAHSLAARYQQRRGTVYAKS